MNVMNIPLIEMGDISPALENLLRVQAEYARGEPGVSRAMRDVARNALEQEIKRYVSGLLNVSPAYATGQGAIVGGQLTGFANTRSKQ